MRYKRDPSKHRSAGQFAPMLSLAFLYVILTLIAVPAIAQESKQQKIDKIKTAYLLNFISFSRWPQKEKPDTLSPIHITIIGDESYTQTLKAALPDNRLGNRPISIKSIQHTAFSDLSDTVKQTITNSHLLYVRQLDYTNFSKLLTLQKPVPFLLVGDLKDFASNGGMIGFRVSQSKVRFEINPHRIRNSNVQVSSKVMRLGIQVKDKE